MNIQLFHIFRNTPFGRETLLQSLYFCKQINAAMKIYIPEFTKFLMYFENDVVQVDLDKSYLTDPKTAKTHAQELIKQYGIEARFMEPKNYTASTLPDIPINFDFMCCPRSVSDLSSKVGLGYIGPRVRRIVKSSRFPVLITSPVYKEWKSITVFFGGSNNSVNALKLGFNISRITGKPLDIFTLLEKDVTFYEKVIQDEGLEKDKELYVNKWNMFNDKNFELSLYEVSHDSLVVLGAYGHGIIKDIIFGSKMEKIQSTIANNFLVVGPNYITTS